MPHIEAIMVISTKHIKKETDDWLDRSKVYAAATARRVPVTGIAFLPHVIVDGMCHGFLDRKALLV